MYKNNLFILSIIFLFSNTIWSASFSDDIENLLSTQSNLRYRLESQDEESEEIFEPIKPTKKLSDLIGLIPYEITDMIISIKSKYENNTPVYTMILYGLPGGGKTTLVEAIAGELNWDFYNIQAGSLLTKYQGSGNSKITKLFKTIKKKNSKVVLFIDEIDGLVNKEHADQNSELQRASQALHQIDSFKENLICIFATNNLEKLPTTILTRFGKKKIEILLPDPEKILAMLQKLLRGYDTRNANLESVVFAMENINCREVEMIADTAIDIASSLIIRNLPDEAASSSSASSSTSNTNYNVSQFLENSINKFRDVSTIEITEDALLISLYTVQNAPCFAESEIQLLLKYYMHRYFPNTPNRTVENLCANLKILDRMIGLSASEIKRVIITARAICIKTKQDINMTNLLKAISKAKSKKFSFLPDNSKEIPLNLDETFENLISLTQLHRINLPHGSLKIIALDAANNFTYNELEKLVILVKKINVFHNISNAHPRGFYLALYRLLETKAKPYCVIELLNTVRNTISSGSLGGSVGLSASAEMEPGWVSKFIVSATVNTSASVSGSYSHNVGSKELRHYTFSLKKIFLSDEKEYKKSQSSGDNIEISRLEYCNIKMPSLNLIRAIIMYYLGLYGMNTRTSIQNIINWKGFKTFIQLSQPSCYTIRDIIQNTCHFASLENFIVCTESHFQQALNHLNFNVDLYAYGDADHLANPDISQSTGDENIASSSQNVETESPPIVPAEFNIKSIDKNVMELPTVNTKTTSTTVKEASTTATKNTNKAAPETKSAPANAQNPSSCIIS